MKYQVSHASLLTPVLWHSTLADCQDFWQAFDRVVN
jgi:hypothetical protein